MAVCKSATGIIASNIVSFIPIALVAIEGCDVSIDASEGDSYKKTSSKETHGMLVIITLCQCQLEQRTGNRIYLYLKENYRSQVNFEYSDEFFY